MCLGHDGVIKMGLIMISARVTGCLKQVTVGAQWKIHLYCA